MVTWRNGAYAVLVAAVATGQCANAPAIAGEQPTPWTGFYFGIHAGYGEFDNDFSRLFITEKVTGITARGAIMGGHAGHNWQFGSLVSGIEIDMSFGDIDGSSNEAIYDDGFGNVSSRQLHDDEKYSGSARLRLGITPFDSLLIYGTAGLAWHRTERTGVTETQLPATSMTTSTSDRWGWVAGVGAETLMFGGNWTGRLEYLRYDFGSVETSTREVYGSASFEQPAGDQTADVLRAALSYRLGTDEVAADESTEDDARQTHGQWAGAYLGVIGGYGMAENDFTLDVSSPAPHRGGDAEGSLVGGLAGYNWQYRNVVAGFEVDMTFAGMKDRETDIVDQGGGTSLEYTQGYEIGYLGSLRARVGYSPVESILLYGTAGLAWERYDRFYKATFTNGGTVETVERTDPRDNFGWVAGVGAEMILMRNVTGRIEYLHYGFDQVETGSKFEEPGESETIGGGKQTADAIRAALAVKFSGQDTREERTEPRDNWSGPYVGLMAGYGRGTNDFSRVLQDSPVVTERGFDHDGGLYGALAGFNVQSGTIVAGLELDLSFTDIQGSKSTAYGASQLDHAQDIKFLGTARGRLGFTALDGILIYGTAGLAWERIEDAVTYILPSPDPIVSERIPLDRFGWVVGAGMEAMLCDSRWIGRIEYQHLDFGTIDSTFRVVDPSVTLTSSGGDQTLDVIRGAILYRLN